MKFDWVIEYDFEKRKAFKRPFKGEDLTEIFVTKFVAGKILLPGVGNSEEMIYTKMRLLETTMDNLSAFGTTLIYLSPWRLFFKYNEITSNEKETLNKIAIMATRRAELLDKYPESLSVSVLKPLTNNEQLVFDGMTELLSKLR